jgi:DNA-binding transcriptional MerR regulator
MKAGLTIGELARELQLNPKTIRYYEQVGLLPRPRRSESGYRLYSREEMERLQLVKRAKLLGLTLAEIKELVEYAIDGRCGAVQDQLFSLLKAKLGEIDQKIQELIIFREDLQRYLLDLSNRTGSMAKKEVISAVPTPCHCIDGEVDSLKK